MITETLCHAILPANLEASSTPTKEILETPFPSEETNMRYLLVACNVYHSIVPKFIRIDSLWNRMLQN